MLKLFFSTLVNLNLLWLSIVLSMGGMSSLVRLAPIVSNAGDAEDVAFFHSAGFHGIITLTAHRNTAAGYGRPRRHRLSTDVDHDGIAILVNMCKRVHKNTYFPKPQFGKVQTGQFRHSPPSPRRDETSVRRNSTVRVAYADWWLSGPEVLEVGA